MSIKKHKKNEIVKFDREAFAFKFSPKNMRKEFRDVTTMQKAVECDKNSISVYRKQSSSEFIEGMIELYLHDLNASINVHEKLNENQIEEIAQEIATFYFHMSLVEIHFVIKEAKRGKYGRINYALNMPEVLSWFDKYAEQRCEYFMQRKTSEEIENKQNAESQIFPKEIIPTMVDAIKSMGEKMDKAKNLKDAEFQIFKEKFNNKK